MGKKKKKSEKVTERQAYGITVLKAAHLDVRKIRKDHEPEIHGNKFWNSSWLIMDYLEQQGLPKKSRVMEVGCGWGLAGIYCAKRFGAKVTGLDADAKVFPYLDLHARVNDVKIKTVESRFEDIKKKKLAKQNLILGADICFWDSLVDPLHKLIGKSLKAGAQQIIIADPGRPPFDEVCDRCTGEFGGVVKDWSVKEPVSSNGYLLIVGGLP